MALRSDFRLVVFNEHLGDKAGDIKAGWANFVGNQTTIRNFYIDGYPTNEAYLILQAYDIHKSGHKILINGQDLGGFDIPPDPGKWQTWMDRIDTTKLKKGNNTIQIVRDASTGDNFIVCMVIIHWRESD